MEKITLFRDTYETHHPDFLPVDEALDRFQNGTYRAKINQLRRLREIDKDRYSAEKTTLPAFVFQGTFPNRANADLQEPSGLFTADIDKITDNLEELKRHIAADPAVFAAFISPSNAGIKALFKIPKVKNNEQYHFVFEKISAHAKEKYGVDIDKACKDVARVCYASYDPDLIVNPDAQEFPIDWEEYERREEEAKRRQEAAKALQQQRAEQLKKDLAKKGASKDKLQELCQKRLQYHLQWMIDCLSSASPSDPNNGRHQCYVKCGILAKSMLDGYASDLTTLSELEAHVASIRSDFRPVDAATFREMATTSTAAEVVTKADVWGEYQEWKSKNMQETPKQTESKKEEAKKMPDWAFWSYSVWKNQSEIIIDPLKYIEFLTACNFRTFIRRGTPQIVEETDDGMNKTETRGRVNTNVKNDVIGSLLDEGFDDVAGFFIVNPKYFTMDVLESLPPIPHEKAQRSIFAEHETRITFDTPLEKEEPLILFGETPVLSPGNTLAIVGKQGLGKSGVCELFASLAVNPKCEKHSPFTCCPKGGLILWIDTERTSNDMVYARQRIYNRIGAKYEPQFLQGNDFKNLRVERCRTVEDKMLWLLELVDSIEENIDMILLDGALDMVDSMNDEAEAKHFFEDIQTIADKRQCGIVLTIHSAPSDEKGKGMGHIGSGIMRKCSSFLQIRNCKDDKSIKELSTDFEHAKMRHGKDWGIYAAIQWDDDDHMLHFIDYTPPEAMTQTDKTREAAQAVFDFLFSFTRQYTYSHLVKAYVEKSGKSERTAKSHIKKAVDVWGFILRNGDTYSLLS